MRIKIKLLAFLLISACGNNTKFNIDTAVTKKGLNKLINDVTIDSFSKWENLFVSSKPISQNTIKQNHILFFGEMHADVIGQALILGLLNKIYQKEKAIILLEEKNTGKEINCEKIFSEHIKKAMKLYRFTHIGRDGKLIEFDWEKDDHFLDLPWEKFKCMAWDKEVSKSLSRFESYTARNNSMANLIAKLKSDYSQIIVIAGFDHLFDQALLKALYNTQMSNLNGELKIDLMEKSRLISEWQKTKQGENACVDHFSLGLSSKNILAINLIRTLCSHMPFIGLTYAQATLATKSIYEESNANKNWLHISIVPKFSLEFQSGGPLKIN